MCSYDPTVTYKKLSFRNIPHQMRLKKIERILQRECKDGFSDSLMDFGCASGFITMRLKQLLKIRKAYGSDALEEYIQQAKKNYPEISFGVVDLNKEHRVPDRFGLVTCFETLEHVGHLETALDNILNSMAPNGIALLSVPIETGLIGTLKFLLKVKVYRDSFHELGADNRKKYFKTLIRGEDISIYRKGARDLWWDHFGFNYKRIESYLQQRGIKFKGFTGFTTRFILIHNR